MIFQVGPDPCPQALDPPMSFASSSLESKCYQATLVTDKNFNTKASFSSLSFRSGVLATIPQIFATFQVLGKMHESNQINLI